MTDDLIAKPKLEIRYKEGQARSALFLVAALSPLWAGWGLYVSSWLAVAVIRGGLTDYLDLFGLLCFYMFLIALGITTIFICLDNKLVLTQKGVELPRRFLLEMAGARKRGWGNLRSIEFKNEDLTMRFDFGVARFKSSGMSTSDLKDLVVAVRSNSPDTNCVFDKRAVALGIPGIQSAPQDESFTALWERDLASRFGSTAFVPLEAKAKLQEGRLTVIGQVSFGGLSAIYLCKDNLGETVIVKEAVVPLNADSASKAKALEMFSREAKILKELNHANVARVMDHFVENDRHYLVLEHINGLDLRAYVKEHGPQPERLIMRWAMEAADVLDYLHSHRPPIVHRDVTPDNLVLDRAGDIKLIDFGAANELLTTATGTLIGKQAYIAPEQFRGKATRQSDIYSLGCTLYYLAVGKDPEALSQSSLPDELAQKMPVLNRLIQDCTAMELKNRVASAADVAHNCRDYLTSIQHVH
ncbi:MAG TPA: serine/threonine-protein kinase [Planktothrix sp.]